MTFLFRFLLLFFFSIPIFAAMSEETDFASIRHLSMGGAGVAMTFDKFALVKNPAGLAYSNFEISLPRLRLEVDKRMMDKRTQVIELADKSKELFDKIGVAQKLVPLNSKNMTSLSPVGAFTIRGFGVAAFTKVNADVKVVNRITPRADIAANASAAPYVGIGQEFDIAGFKFAAGASAKYLLRHVVYDPNTGNEKLVFSMTTLLEMAQNGEVPTINTYEGAGVGFDAGALIPISLLGKGHVGVAVNNINTIITGTRIIDSSGNSGTFKTQIGMTTTLGIGENVDQANLPFLEKLGSFTYAIDYTFSSEDSLYKKIHIGIEKPIFDKYLKFRGGLYQGFVVGGLSLDLAFLKLDYAIYTRETGFEVTADPVSSHVVQLGLLF